VLVSSFGRAHGTVLRRNSLLIFREGGTGETGKCEEKET